jgi:hypothetical protein
MTSTACFIALLSVFASNTPDLSREFQGVRSSAMGGAHRGVGTSNDTVILNPAGMATLQRYSKSGPVAGGLAYTLDRGKVGDTTVMLHRLYLAAAYAITDNIGFGLTNKHVRGDYADSSTGARDVAEYSADLGLNLVTNFGAALGITYQNLIRSKNTLLSPPALGFGLAYNSTVFVIAADLILDMRDMQNKRLSYLVGGEYFLARMFALRAGYARRPFREAQAWAGDENMVTSGLGFIDKAGALDVTYSQSVTRLNHWDIIAALKMYF